MRSRAWKQRLGSVVYLMQTHSVGLRDTALYLSNQYAQRIVLRKAR